MIALRHPPYIRQMVRATSPLPLTIRRHDCCGHGSRLRHRPGSRSGAARGRVERRRGGAPGGAAAGDRRRVRGRARGADGRHRSPESVDALFATTVDRFGRVDLLFNNAGLGAVGAGRRAGVRGLAAGRGHEPDRLVPVRAGRVPGDGRAGAAGRADHQQRLDLGVRPRPYAIAYNATKHAVTGLTKSLSLEGRAFDIACGQIDIGNAATEMTERMSGGVPQADGSLKPEPTMDVAHVGRAIVYMASLPLDANVQYHDGDGDENALRRPRLKILAPVESAGPSSVARRRCGRSRRRLARSAASSCSSAARRGSARRGWSPRSRRGRRAGRAARRVRRVRRRGARLRAGRRGAARPARGLVGGRASTGSRPRRAARWPPCFRASRRGDGGPGRLYELLLDLLGRLAAERAGAARARGHPLGRSLDARAARVPGPQPARRADRRARHLPRRRRAPAAAAPPRERAAPAADGAARSSSSRCAPRRRRPPAGGDRGRPGRRPRSSTSCTPAPAGTRSSSRSCSRRPRRRETVAEAVARARSATASVDARRALDATLAGGRRARVRTRCSTRSRSSRTRCARRSTPGVLVRERDGVAFRHGLIGEVVYERLLPGERVAAASRDRRARSTIPPSARTTASAPGCATRRWPPRSRPGSRPRGVFAYAEAGVHLERALELWDGDVGVDRVDLLARAAQAARFSGDPERAVARCREAIALERRSRAPRAALRAPRRVPLLGRRGGAAVLRAGARADARRAAACSPPRGTR